MAERLIRDPDGAILKVAEYDGHLTQPFPGIGQRFDNLPNITVRDDDVVVVGYPKSGNNWMWQLVDRLITANDGQFTRYMGDRMLEARDDTILSAQESPRVLMTHLPPRILSRARDLVNGRVKIINVARNPKDVAVSFYTQTHSMRVLYGYDGSWAGYLELFLKGTVDSGSWFDHTFAWERFRQDNPQVSVHLVYYEDLQKDLLAEIKKVAAFLDVSQDERFYRAVCGRLQFSAMKKHQDEHANAELISLYRDGKPTMLRKGIIGDWKNVFTVNQSERFDAVYAERMKISKMKFRFEPFNVERH